MEENSVVSLQDVLKYKDDYNGLRNSLKEHKFDFDEVDIFGKTLLIHLVQYDGPLESVWFCLEFFADPNIQDNDGNTALHYAFTKTNKNYIYVLLLFNADLEIRNKEENTEEINGKTPNEKTNLFKEDDYEKLRKIFDDKLKLVFANLTRQRRDQLREIYNFLDDLKSGLSVDKLISFNIWLNEDSNEAAKEDANTFMNLAKLFGGSSVTEILFEEWIIALTRISKFHGISKIDDLISLFNKLLKSGKKLDEGY